ncbi:MAG: hypothetical protein KGK11_13910 [Sphingomonadales bacterium]|nr:hypothetical protein [Sphingomonadales bacterium]
MNEEPAAPTSTPLARPGRERRMWPMVSAAFLLGLGCAGWLGWRSGADFPRLLGLSQHAAPAAPRDAGVRPTADVDALSPRVAALEQRIDRIDSRADMVAADAAHVEGLLTAFAVRRRVERDMPLGGLADPLRLRFGDSQPGAVATIIDEAWDFTPLDQLAARLATLAPQLTDPQHASVWTALTEELSQIFVIRRDRPTPPDAAMRLSEARLALGAGRIDAAIAAIETLPHSAEATNWIVAARRTRDVEHALDLIDTTALLPPPAPRTTMVLPPAGDGVAPAAGNAPASGR